MYHQQPPFVIGGEKDKQGMIYDIAELLNKKFKGEMSFEVIFRPRARLNSEIKDWIESKCPSSAFKCDNNWVVFGVSPRWGWGKDPEHQFLWVDLFRDEDVIISSNKSNIEYKNPDSLTGKVFASITGRHCPPVLCKAIEAGKIKREDGTSTVDIIPRLFFQHADFALMQKSTFNYLLKFNSDIKKLENGIHVSAVPLDSYTVKIMIPVNRPDLYRRFVKISKDPEWKNILIKFGAVKSLGDLK